MKNKSRPKQQEKQSEHSPAVPTNQSNPVIKMQNQTGAGNSAAQSILPPSSEPKEQESPFDENASQGLLGNQNEMSGVSSFNAQSEKTINPSSAGRKKKNPVNLNKPVPVLLEEIKKRMQSGTSPEDSELLAMYHSAHRRMRGRTQNTIGVCQGGIQSSKKALQSLTIVSSSYEKKRRQQILSELQSYLGILNTLKVQIKGLTIGNKPGTTVSYVAPKLQEYYNGNYLNYVVVDRVGMAIDQKSNVGRFGRGQDKIIEDAAKAFANMCREIAKWLVQQFCKRYKINEALSGYIFDVAWDLAEEIGSQVVEAVGDFIMTGDYMKSVRALNIERILKKLMHSLWSRAFEALIAFILGKIKDAATSPLPKDNLSASQTIAKLFIELKVDISADMIKKIVSEWEKKGNLLDAIKATFSFDNLSMYFAQLFSLETFKLLMNKRYALG